MVFCILKPTKVLKSVCNLVWARFSLKPAHLVDLTLIGFLVQKGSFDAEKKTVQLQSSLVGNASKVRNDSIAPLVALQPDHVSVAFTGIDALSAVNFFLQLLYELG